MFRFPFIRVGLIFAFAPLLFAFFSGLIRGVSMWDEGSGAGTYLWFLLITLPGGFLLLVIGVVAKIVRYVHRKAPGSMS